MTDISFILPVLLSAAVLAVLKPLLALCSLGFITVAKPVIGYGYRRYMKQQSKQEWRCLSNKTINSPWVLPYMMSHGPRLNPHAIIGLFGPFKVSQTLQIAKTDMQHSAQDWTVVVYALPGLATVASAGASDDERSGGSEHTMSDSLELTLPPGNYLLGLRYYHWQNTVNLPAVSVDRQPLAPTQRQSATSLNEFHYHHSENRQWLYKALNYYVYWMLRYQHYLPRQFVDKQYLPVGNPNTVFKYSKIELGEVLQLAVNKEMNIGVSTSADASAHAQTALAQGDVFYCIYNQASLPVSFGQLTRSSVQLPSPTRGTVLIRLCCHQQQHAALWAQQFTIRVGQQALQVGQQVL